MTWPARLLVLAVAAAALAGVGYALWPRPVGVELGKAVKGRFEQTVDEDGKTRVRDRYVVAAPTAGTVLRVALKAGDEVAQDAVVARILPGAAPLLDARTRQELEQRVGAAEALQAKAHAAVLRAQSTLEQAQADSARSQSLGGQGIVPRSRVEHDALAVKLAGRELEAAQSEEHAAGHTLEQARAALARSTESGAAAEPFDVRSPVAGRVFKVFHEDEGPVAVGAPLLEIGDPGNLEVVVDVLSTDAVSIKPGDRAAIVRWGSNTALEGRVRRVEPSAFTKVSALGIEEQRVNVIVDLVSPRTDWRNLGDGYRVETRIVTFAADDAVIVPMSALFRDGDSWAVFAAVDGKARKKTVNVVRHTGTEAMIDAGARPGDVVILYPGDAIRDGVSIIAR